MSNMNLSVPFQIPQEEAINRIKAYVTRARVQHADKIGNSHEEWNGNVGTFSSVDGPLSVSGSLTVDPSVVVVEVSLPLAAVFFKGKIEAAIREQLTRLLS